MLASQIADYMRRYQFRSAKVMGLPVRVQLTEADYTSPDWATTAVRKEPGTDKMQVEIARPDSWVDVDRIAVDLTLISQEEARRTLQMIGIRLPFWDGTDAAVLSTHDEEGRPHSEVRSATGGCNPAASPAATPAPAPLVAQPAQPQPTG